MAEIHNKSVTWEKRIRWVARIWSILSIAFFLVMAIGEGFFARDSADFSSMRDKIAFTFFPIGIFLGLILSWRWEGIGGVIVIGSIFAFYLTLWLYDGKLPRGPYFALLATPGLLFLVSWWLSKKQVAVAA